MPDPTEIRPRRSDDFLPDERVHAALRRAAQLQAEAAERLERQARERIHAQDAEIDRSAGFRRHEIEAAAVEAGISAEYIRQALLEQDALGENATELAPWKDRLGDRMLGTRRRSLDLSRVIDAEPAAVLESMQRILPRHPYRMMLVDAVGGAATEGGVLTFEIPRIPLESTSGTPFGYAARAVDLLQIHVRLRAVPLGDERTGCEVTLTGDLRTSISRNVWAGLGIASVGGGAAAVGGTAIALAAGVLMPLTVAAAAAGLALGTPIAGAGYGLVYRYYLQKMISELETLLKIVDTNARTGGAFPSLDFPQRPGDPDDLLLGGS